MARASATVHCTIITSLRIPIPNATVAIAGSGSTSARAKGARANVPPVSTTNRIGLRGTKRSDTTPPAIRPSASAAVIAPQAAGPPRRACATTGPSTWKPAYQAIIATQNWITITHSHVCERNSAQPSRSSRSMPGGAAVLAGARLGLRASISGMVPVMPRPHTVMAQPGPAAATTSPPTAAPAIWPPFIASLLTELASCSNESGTSRGSSAWDAG